MDQEFGLIVIGDEILKGKRRDRHFEAFRKMLGKRGLTLAWLQLLPDDPNLLIRRLRNSTGVSCVGKTTIGRRLAELMGLRFFDLDTEIEQFFGMSIERFKKSYTRADLQVSIEDRDVEQAAQHLLAQINVYRP